ncbi:T9SS type A sorting domain-containing protein [uncultured Draconibacterium sp.]|uniref:T9SS type A sorting domain-containing protein n=1 Tax=uncultured Draconibacterium sp. TaxID=1573823 RepID=UPI003260614D
MRFIILLVLSVFIGFNSYAQTGNETIPSHKKTENQIKIFPNPCKNNKVTIDYPSKEISQIRLTNITGKQVFLKKYDFPLPKVQLQLNEIPNGIYIIQITTSDNKHTAKKLMISRN